ncbi:LOC110794626 isoform [Fagus crenata]
MASVPSSSPPPPSPPSASNSDNSATSPTPSLTPTNSLQLDGDGATTNNGPLNVDDKKPDLPDLFKFVSFMYLDSTDYSEKFKNYEADYTFRLMAKYFSKRNLYGVLSPIPREDFLDGRFSHRIIQIHQ